MSYQDDPNMRRRGPMESDNTIMWLAGILAVILVFAVLAWGLSSRTNTAANTPPPSASTTGSGISNTPLRSTGPVSEAPPTTTPAPANRSPANR